MIFQTSSNSSVLLFEENSRNSCIYTEFLFSSNNVTHLINPLIRHV